MTLHFAAAVVAVVLASTTLADGQTTQEPAPRAEPPGGQDGARANGPRRALERARRLEDRTRARRAARQGANATAVVSRVVRLGRDGSLDLTNAAGRVSVNGVAGDDVRIEATKRVWHEREEEARALLEALNVVVSEGAGRVGIRTEYPRQQAYDAEVEYVIAVPQNTRVTLRVASGDITVSNLKGELRAESVGGAVTATSVGDVRLARSVSGDVSVDGATGTELVASTLRGAITVRRVKARSIDLRSIGGALRLSESDADRVSMQTLTGPVEYDGRIGRNGRYDLQSRSGRIVVAPTGDDGFDVEAATRDGALRSDFPLTVREMTPRGGGRGGRAGTMQGTVGGGGGLLTIRSFSGAIAIVRR